MRGQPVILVLYLAATLAAFGGIYPWALPPIVAGALLLTLLSWRAPAVSSPETRALDWAIVTLLLAMAAQLVPLPGTWRSLLSPHAADVERALSPAAALPSVASAPLSIDPEATANALALVFATALTYLSARRLFGAGGVRFVCQALGVIAAVAAIGALVQRALTPRLMYGLWPPQDPGGIPFGPVVNRNHFAAWLLMVSALTAGHVIARVSRRAHDSQNIRAWRRRLVVDMAQSSIAWTVAACLVVTVTVLASQSRSAVVGLAAAGITLTRSITRGWKPTAVVLTNGFVLSLMLVAAGEATVTRLANRLVTTFDARQIDRLVIWRETMPMLADFRLTGVGAGAFERAMLAYQQTRVFVPHLGMHWHFNQAHNHYLQLATEGGVLVTVPALIVMILFLRLASKRLREDAGTLRAVRVGALAGLAGIAVQSIWEVPLTMPAAALLAATLAAIATYTRPATETSK